MMYADICSEKDVAKGQGNGIENNGFGRVIKPDEKDTQRMAPQYINPV